MRAASTKKKPYTQNRNLFVGGFVLRASKDYCVHINLHKYKLPRSEFTVRSRLKKYAPKIKAAVFFFSSYTKAYDRNTELDVEFSLFTPRVHDDVFGALCEYAQT